MDAGDEEITLRVGSRDFRTRRSTLAQYPDTVLYKSLSFNGPRADFWDRDEEAFACLLDFYRTGRLAPPPTMSMDKLARELGFWGFTLETETPTDRRARAAQPPTHLLRPPLGTSLRAADQGCHYVLLCLAWAAIGRMEALWEAAQLGLRQLCIYWKCHTYGLSISSNLLQSHRAFLDKLAALDRCRIEILTPVSVCEINRQSRQQDVVTRGNLTFDGFTGRTVHQWKLRATVQRDGHRVTFFPEEGAHTAFDHHGFHVRVHVVNQRLRWSISVAEQDDQGGFDEERTPATLPSTHGFMLETKVVYQSSLLTSFFFPSSFARSDALSSDVFYSQCFTVPDPAPDDWYLQDHRHAYLRDIQLDYTGYDRSEAQDIVVLFEDREDATLSYSKGNAYFAEHEDELYDRVVVCW